MPNSGTSAGRKLTARERQVLQYAALGLRNREIGESLHIAEQTVKNHIGNAMRKLELHDRTYAVVFAIGSGLISMPAPDNGRPAEGNRTGVRREVAVEPLSDRRPSR